MDITKQMQDFRPQVGFCSCNSTTISWFCEAFVSCKLLSFV